MASGGGGPAAASSVEDGSPAPLDGAFLLQLLRNPPRAQPTAPLAAPPPYGSPQRQDPAVQAVGPSFPFLPHNFLHPPLSPPPNPLQVPPGFQHPSWAQPAYPSPPLPFFRGDVRQPGPPAGGFATPPTSDRQRDFGFRPPDGVSANRMHRNIPSSKSSNSGSLSRGREEGSSANAQKQKAHMARAHGPLDRNHYHGEQPRSAPPSERRTVEFQRSGVTEQARQPGPLRRPTKGSIGWFPMNERWERMHDDGAMEESYRERNQRVDSYSYMERDLLRGESPASNANRRLDRPMGAAGSSRPSDDGSEVEEPLDESQDDNGIDGQAIRSQRDERKGDMNGSASRRAALKVQEQIMESLILEDEPAGKSVVRRARTSRGKEIRFDTLRGHHISSQRMRIRKRVMECRRDIESLTPLFLTIYESLIPAEEEKAKQKQLLRSLGKLVNREWPKAQLHLYGSCANSFGVSNSDIDVCLAIGDDDMSKSEILLKLADILQSDNLQNVQALTHARVPIVKLMDPVTGISCDICINNLLAVVNTKLLRDYAQIDDRLRQLAFIVKHWAKSRGVNETYRGTLSSYAYVLMCIHFLQLRKPAVLPCLQQMETTYVVTIDDTECAYFDQVEKLHNFGAQNKESIARLLWAFFHYWAYYHDYANDVISVRTGSILSKRVKDWTRRIGNDRHLICIEDPFEISHDLGRVVDKYSIKVLREEFERAADILQYDPNPSVTLFEPYMPGSPQDQLHSNLDDL